jgi:hypothetical protein
MMSAIMKLLEKWLKRGEAKKQDTELAEAPKTLDEAVQFLLNTTSETDSALFAKEPEDSPGASIHFFAGMAMRNRWGLWKKEQPLTQWFRERRIWHADDMSAVIYKAFWCKLNNKPFDINVEVVYYLNYWFDQGIGFDGEVIEGAKRKTEIKLRNGLTIHTNYTDK